MLDEFMLESPVDMHVHFREGEMMRQVVPLTAYSFAGGLVMPNTSEPITTLEQVVEYKHQIVQASVGSRFSPYMTLYFKTDYTKEFLKAIKPYIFAIKFYSRGMTTNSHHGTEPHDHRVEQVLEYMEELEIPLCTHGEAKGYWLDREKKFHEYWIKWANKFPNLKIIAEHISDGNTVDLLEEIPNLYATVTLQHTLFDTDDFCGDMLRPHRFFKPLMKRPEDKEKIRNLILMTNPSKKRREAQKKTMLGTDSAPHDESKKLCDCGCAGMFTAPIALQAFAEEFRLHSNQERFQEFASDNAQRIYNFKPPHKRVHLVREPFLVPHKFYTVVPEFAGQTLPWSIKLVN